MKRFGKFASVCVTAAVLLAAPFAHAQVLDQVPSDAMVVVKFNKLKAVSDKIGAMGQKLGIAAFVPQLSDPLGALKDKGKLQNGFDDNGEAAFVFTGVPADGQEPPLLVFLPVTDYKAFLTNFPGAKTEGDVSEVHFDGETDAAYTANWGKYAVISPKKEMVSQKPASAGLKASGMAAKELDEKDIVAYVNMKGARDKILPQMEKAKAEFLKDFEKNYANSMAGGQPGMRRNGQAAAPAAPDPQALKYMPLARSFMSRVFDVAEQAVRDADSATWGISITADGLKFSGLSEFTPATPSAQTVAAFKGSDQSMLNGLPQAKYLFYGGMSFGDSQAWTKAVADFMGPIQPEIVALGDDGKSLQNYIDAAVHWASAMKTSSFGMLTPTGALGQEAIVQVLGVTEGDSKAMLDAQKQMADSMQTAMDIFSAPQMRGMMTATYKPAAKTIDGVTFNEIQMQFAPPKAGQHQNAQAMQMKQMMTWMYGPNGMGSMMGAVDANKVVAVVGAKDEMASQLIASAKTNEDVLSKAPSTAAVQKELPATHVVAGYFALDQFATTLAGYAKMFGMPVNFQLPQNLPPIGFSAGTDGTAVRADAYVPAQLLQSIIAAGIQSYMQMQGGQAPGGPGGL